MEIEQSNENPHQQHSPDISDDDDALDDAMEYGVEEFTDETDQSLAPESEIESDFESSSSESHFHFQFRLFIVILSKSDKITQSTPGK